MSKIAILRPTEASPTAILADVANRDDLDGVIIMARVGGKWSTTWSAGVTLASLCMATMKLQADVTSYMHDEQERGPLPDKAS